MDAFALIIFGLLALLLAWAVIAGRADRRAASRIARQRVRRDLIAAGVIKADQVDRIQGNENARRRGRGLGALRRRELESKMLADGGTRRRLLIWKGKR
jgi:hypothetical protein